MAKEYIEREAAIADLEKYETAVYRDEHKLAIAGCRSHIRHLPAANVRKNVTGEWKQRRDKHNGSLVTDEWYGPICVCSLCGEEMLGTPNYCPNCGASMTGGNNG